MGETVARNTEPVLKMQHCDEAPQTNSSCTAMCDVYVIVFDESDNVVAILAVDATRVAVEMVVGAPDPVLSESMNIYSDIWADLEDAKCDNARDDAWDIRH